MAALGPGLDDARNEDISRAIMMCRNNAADDDLPQPVTAPQTTGPSCARAMLLKCWPDKSLRAAAALLLWATQLAAAPVEDAKFAALRTADMRLASIGFRLATANAGLCTRQQPGTGLVVHTIDQYAPTRRSAAQRHFGFATPVAVMGVVDGSPAASAGIRQDDSLQSIAGTRLPISPAATSGTERVVATHALITRLPAHQPFVVEVLRDGLTLARAVRPIPACASRFEVEIARDYIARADGEVVQIGVRNLEEYDADQIAVTVAHELAHNILRHRNRLKAAGVDTDARSFDSAKVGYIRQTEIEADLLSVYLLRNAGYDPKIASEFWWNVGPRRARLFRRGTHPHWRERAAMIDREIAGIGSDKGGLIVPSILRRRDEPLDGDWRKLLRRAAP